MTKFRAFAIAGLLAFVVAFAGVGKGQLTADPEMGQVDGIFADPEMGQGD